ncbi:MAG: nicotinate-nucleotide--dimethylbenzimidazole phosphoribosyltransferase [Spirochaetales bacterium]|nr:nicotinate-nucleotide--dimethylbenzimidazole phosphoribosyltransferase [Spirochaetales bacterium]
MSLHQAIQNKIDQKTKPLGSLGLLEDTAAQIARIQNSLSPELRFPRILVFAADHGLARAGVSTYPQEVTFQMVMNFLSGGAAINVFCRTHGLDLKIVDAGVNYDFPPELALINRKMAHGTRNCLLEKAMTTEECQKAMTTGAELVQEAKSQGTNIIGFGEMGIGNSSSAALLMSQYLGLPISECTGRGTGWNDEGLKKKTEILEQVLEKHGRISDPLEILTTFGGFEIAMIAGAMLQAAREKMIILVDGFICTAANLAALKMDPLIRDYCIYCHQSDESGHKKMLEAIGAKALLNMGLRLGEGTGAALAYPLIESAVDFFNKMASFESAGVSEADQGSLE